MPPKTSKRIISVLFIIFFAFCIAGCEKTNGNGVQVNATPDVAATPAPTVAQTSTEFSVSESSGTNNTVPSTNPHEIFQTPEEEILTEKTPTEEFSTE